MIWPRLPTVVSCLKLLFWASTYVVWQLPWLALSRSRESKSLSLSHPTCSGQHVKIFSIPRCFVIKFLTSFRDFWVSFVSKWRISDQHLLQIQDLLFCFKKKFGYFQTLSTIVWPHSEVNKWLEIIKGVKGWGLFIWGGNVATSACNVWWLGVFVSFCFVFLYLLGQAWGKRTREIKGWENPGAGGGFREKEKRQDQRKRGRTLKRKLEVH